MKIIRKILDIREALKVKGIKNDVLRIAMSGSILIAGIFGCLFLVGSLIMSKIMTDKGDEWREGQVELVEKYTRQELKKQLEETVRMRHDLIENSLRRMEDSAYVVAKGAETILDNPQHYSPRKLPGSRHNSIPVGKGYVHYNNDLLRYTPPEVQAEWDIMNNIEDYFKAAMDRLYGRKMADIALVSDKGYVTTMDFDPSGSPTELDDDYCNSYDPRNRSEWYKEVKETEKVSYSELSVGADGEYYIHLGVPYYHKGAFAGAVGIGINITDIYNQLVNRGDYKRLKIFVVNENGQVIMSSENEGSLAVKKEDMRLREDEFASAVKHMTAAETGLMRTSVDGISYFLAFTPIRDVGWYYGVLTEESRVQEESQETQRSFEEGSEEFQGEIQGIFLVMILAGFLLFFLSLYLVLKRAHHSANKFVKPIEGLIEGVETVAAGNFLNKLPINQNNEFDKLAEAVNNMGEQLKKHIEEQAEKERINAELSLATDIQMGVLPHVFPPFPEKEEFVLYASMTPAKEVGGDFYDFYLLDDNHLCVTIADVSGKGVGAALFMVVSKTMLKNFISEANGKKLEDVIGRVNDQINEENPTFMFVTAFVGILDLKTGVFTYVNCGHNAPLVYSKKDGRCRYLDDLPDLVLAVMKGSTFNSRELQLAPGDKLFLYTDGVTEAMNENGELYGEDRLLAEIKPDLPPDELIKDMITNIAAYRQSAEQSDDITMLALTYTGAS